MQRLKRFPNKTQTQQQALSNQRLPGCCRIYRHFQVGLQHWASTPQKQCRCSNQKSLQPKNQAECDLPSQPSQAANMLHLNHLSQHRNQGAQQGFLPRQLLHCRHECEQACQWRQQIQQKRCVFRTCRIVHQALQSRMHGMPAKQRFAKCHHRRFFQATCAKRQRMQERL